MKPFAHLFSTLEHILFFVEGGGLLLALENWNWFQLAYFNIPNVDVSILKSWNCWHRWLPNFIKEDLLTSFPRLSHTHHIKESKCSTMGAIHLSNRSKGRLTTRRQDKRRIWESLISIFMFWRSFIPESNTHKTRFFEMVFRHILHPQIPPFCLRQALSN